jgi:predicted dehydrogenase
MKIGIVGTGVMGGHHLRVVNSIPELQLACAADINPQNLETACQPYTLNKFSDYRKIKDQVDAVMISTPTESHFEIAKFFLENRTHVLIEKPITQTIPQVDELIRISKKENLVLASGHPERFNPAVIHIKELVKNPLFIEVQRLGSFSTRSLDVDVILDLMIHDIDIILQWDRSGIKNINASGIPIISKKIDIANVRLEFNSGLVTNMTASRVSQKKTRKLRIFQKNRYFSIDYKKQRVKTYSLNQGQIDEEIPEIQQVEPLFTLWNNFQKSITGGSHHNVTAEQARSALQIAIHILEHIKPIEI